ncbi:S41 family peptidase [Chitinophaga sp. S165]|uniref:S41 family peptidase n=1 Tax=Chitinophaga sp. S165 TaxID=2135462 RepID=UPI000D709A34|nr:S41 family peptidase [Chitinophaga sp. S165]PWV46575.1 tricorn protease-like protein [Chitinophaga sp. S165]
MKKSVFIPNLFLLITLLSNSIIYAQSYTTAGYAPLKADGKVHPHMKGYWKSVGDGYILDATGDSILLYSYTTHFCYKEKNDYIEGLLNSQARFKTDGSQLTILSTDYGGRSADLQTPHHYVRIANLPKGTMTFDQMRGSGPVTLFQLYIETMRENYAFSKERQLNWDSIQSKYGKQISNTTTNAELFKVLGEIATLTKDQHTKVIAEDGKTLQYRGVRSAALLAEAFNKQSIVKNLDQYFNQFFDTGYKNISDSLLQGKGQKVTNKQIEWGSLNQSVGYINIHSFNGFAPRQYSRKQQIDSVDASMKDIIRSLQDKDALIIDVSFNFGGYDAAFLAIASFFTEKPVYAYTSEVFNNGRFNKESMVYIKPYGSVSFTKPVYILMSDISRSAAEGFAMTMKSLPNVKLVGTNTLGTLSAMLGKSIGDFYVTLSNQRFVDADSKCYEVTGLIPDIPLVVFPKENLFNGHMEAVRAIVSRIDKR